MDKPNAPDSKAVDDKDLELPDIEFVAQGTFSIHNPETSSAPITWAAAEFKLGGEQRELIKAEDIDAVRSHTLSLLQQAQGSLCIYSPDLEPWLYNHSCIQQSCSEFLLDHPKNNISI